MKKNNEIPQICFTLLYLSLVSSYIFMSIAGLSTPTKWEFHEFITVHVYIYSLTWYLVIEFSFFFPSPLSFVSFVFHFHFVVSHWTLWKVNISIVFMTCRHSSGILTFLFPCCLSFYKILDFISGRSVWIYFSQNHAIEYDFVAKKWQCHACAFSAHKFSTTFIHWTKNASENEMNRPKKTVEKKRQERNEMNKYKSQWMASGHEQSEWSTFNRIDNERHTRTFSNKINTHVYNYAEKEKRNWSKFH